MHSSAENHLGHCFLKNRPKLETIFIPPVTTNLNRHVKTRWWFIYLPFSIFIKPFVEFMTKNNLDGAQTTLFCVLVTF